MSAEIIRAARRSQRAQIVAAEWHVIRRGGAALMGIGVLMALLLFGGGAAARWKPEYAKADPEIRAWYRSQHNAQGQWCCDESDGHPFFGGYTLNKAGSVTLDLAGGRKHTIPAYMVIAGPNPTGHAVWWFLIDGAGNHTDFCFAPGTLT